MNKLPSFRLASRILCLLPLLLLGNAARATIYHFDTMMSGAAEVPANASPGTGVADIYFDDANQLMRVIVSFSGLLGTTTASHIHAATALANTGTAGVATQTPTFAGFPLGVTAGSYDHVFDMTLASSFNASYVTANGGVSAASAALLNAMLAEKAYLNVHSTFAPGGEIRGFLHGAVPDTGSTLLFLSASVTALAVIGRRRPLAN
ncbi:MAG TPA: CHRD domain-containing protein [Lacunisphaera sp.]|nr:CHRD domain-containing protein [Lacunisphaera sp.]